MTVVSPRPRPASLAVVLALTAPACIGPQVDDEPGPGTAVLPAGSVLPSADDDPELAEQIEEQDGVEDTVPLDSAFAAGGPIGIWDFGPAPAFAAPLFVLGRRDGDTFVQLPHPSIVDVAPGDPGYSPYWTFYRVYVTDAYAGEIIPSVAALDEALRRGLIEPPEAQEDVAVNCPILAADVLIERDGGRAPVGPPSIFHYRGVRVHYADLGPMPIIDRTVVPEVRRYVVRREGQEPLSEPIRHVDITGDGDTRDSNDICDLDPAAAKPSPACRTVNVVVPATTGSIDTSGDQTMADLRRADQLFAPGPVAGTVVAFDVTDELHNCALVRDGVLP